MLAEKKLGKCWWLGSVLFQTAIQFAPLRRCWGDATGDKVLRGNWLRALQLYVESFKPELWRVILFWSGRTFLACVQFLVQRAVTGSERWSDLSKVTEHRCKPEPIWLFLDLVPCKSRMCLVPFPGFWNHSPSLLHCVCHKDRENPQIIPKPHLRLIIMSIYLPTKLLITAGDQRSGWSGSAASPGAAWLPVECVLTTGWEAESYRANTRWLDPDSVPRGGFWGQRTAIPIALWGTWETSTPWAFLQSQRPERKDSLRLSFPICTMERKTSVLQGHGEHSVIWPMCSRVFKWIVSISVSATVTEARNQIWVPSEAPFHPWRIY